MTLNWQCFHVPVMTFSWWTNGEQICTSVRWRITTPSGNVWSIVERKKQLSWKSWYHSCFVHLFIQNKNKKFPLYNKAKGMTSEITGKSEWFILVDDVLVPLSERKMSARKIWRGEKGFNNRRSDVRQDLVTARLRRLWRVYGNVLYTVILEQNLGTVLMAGNTSSKERRVTGMIQLVDISRVLNIVNSKAL